MGQRCAELYLAKLPNGISNYDSKSHAVSESHQQFEIILFRLVINEMAVTKKMTDMASSFLTLFDVYHGFFFFFSVLI